MDNLETQRLDLHEGHEDEFGDESEEMLMDEEHPMWRSERITLNSVGIDIGSSTSHLIFSRLTLRRQGVALSSRFVVINREIIHESPILLTPYVDKTTIDTNKLGDFIHEAYRNANLTPEDIDTGALIVTGEATKKKNAEAISALFSAEAGKFVCATAGHNLEAILAAYGSGAVHMTYHEGGDFTVMNVDVGGGTSKIAIVQSGKVIDSCAVEVGARLVAMDENGVINRLEDTALKIAKMAGVSLRLGDVMSEDDKEKFSKVLCDSLFAVMERGQLSPQVKDLLLTPNLDFKDQIHAVMFSGGVSEFVYGYEKRNLGDLGIQLGRRVRARANQLGGGNVPLRPAEVRIRATVIGLAAAAQFAGRDATIRANRSDPRYRDQAVGGKSIATFRRNRHRADRGLGASLGARAVLSADSHPRRRFGRRDETAHRPRPAAGSSFRRRHCETHGQYYRTGTRSGRRDYLDRWDRP